MNILFILGKMHNYAGMERIFTAKMNYLATSTDFSVAFMTYEQEDVKLPFKLNDNITYYNCNAPIANREQFSFKAWVPQFLKTKLIFKKNLCSVLQKQDPDIVICTTYSFDILNTIITCCKQQGKKLIIESHVEASTILISAKNKYNKYLYRLSLLYDSYILKHIRKADCIITLTHNDAAFFKKHNNNVEVIPNILTINPIKVKDYNIKNVIAAGRYSYQKGFDMLIKAWSIVALQHNDWSLNIWGNGDFTEYKALAEKLGVHDSIFFNHATTNIAKEFSNSSIFVLSSRYEGFGLVLTEAMSCGLPCIAFDCPYGPSEIIKNNIDGILVKNQDINQLASELSNMMDNVAKRKEIGEQAAINVQRFSATNIMKTWINLLNNL